MKTMVLIIIASLAVAGAVAGLASLFASDCEDTIKTEIRSPNGKYTATVFERDCGATTDFSTIINLRESSAKFRGDDLGAVIIKGQHRIDLVWDGNRRLQLQCSDCRPEDIFKQERNWKDVEISLAR